MAGQRKFVRKPFGYQAVCHFPNGETHNCSFRDVSTHGAMLHFPSRPQLPERFVLDMPGNIVVRRLCLRRWQRGSLAGVSFYREREDEVPAWAQKPETVSDTDSEI